MLDLSGAIRTLLAAGDRAGASAKLAELDRRLAPHARREERGVFAALREQGDFAAEVLDLEADHRAFDETLADLDTTAPRFTGWVDVPLTPQSGGSALGSAHGTS